ncbi:MAG: preprotein translocase subunit YajC [Cytophagaceae bacterium]
MFTILLQAKGGSDYFQFALFGLIAVIFYFFMIRPQQKKAKDQKVFRESIKKGDEIVTIGGLHGKIASLESDDTFYLEVDKGIKLRFERSAISLEASKKLQAEPAK